MAVTDEVQRRLFTEDHPSLFSKSFEVLDKGGTSLVEMLWGKSSAAPDEGKDEDGGSRGTDDDSYMPSGVACSLTSSFPSPSAASYATQVSLPPSSADAPPLWTGADADIIAGRYGGKRGTVSSTKMRRVCLRIEGIEGQRWLSTESVREMRRSATVPRARWLEPDDPLQIDVPLGCGTGTSSVSSVSLRTGLLASADETFLDGA